MPAAAVQECHLHLEAAWGDSCSHCMLFCTLHLMAVCSLLSANSEFARQPPSSCVHLPARPKLRKCLLPCPADFCIRKQFLVRTIPHMLEPHPLNKHRYVLGRCCMIQTPQIFSNGRNLVGALLPCTGMQPANCRPACLCLGCPQPSFQPAHVPPALSLDAASHFWQPAQVSLLCT